MNENHPMLHKPRILKPSLKLLPLYAKALHQGWSPTTIEPEAKRLEQIEHIQVDPQGFVDQMNCRAPTPASNRLPNRSYWFIHNNEFAGNLSLRWRAGTQTLPPHCLGHIGYNITPKFQGHGWASWAIQKILPDAWEEGLTWVDITCDPTNIASQKTALNAGADFVEVQTLGAPFHKDILLFRIMK